MVKKLPIAQVDTSPSLMKILFFHFKGLQLHQATAESLMTVATHMIRASFYLIIPRTTRNRMPIPGKLSFAMPPFLQTMAHQ